jgi:hypothetical protein
MKMMIWLLSLKKGIIKMSFSTPRSTDICSCSACGKQQERYLFVIENDLYVCVQCWLSNANKYIANESVENRINELESVYRNKYFSSN